MAKTFLPERGRPQMLIEAAGEASVLDLDPAVLVDHYKTHGALLLRGFPADVAAFNGFARQFCTTSVMNESPGRQAIAAEHNIHTVDGGVRAFSLHPELSREPWKPDAAFFHCLSAPLRGGATTVCDGVALAAALPAAVRQGLAGRRLVYIKATWPALLDYWLGTPAPTDTQLLNPPAGCPYLFRKVDGEIVRIFTRPALHRPMFADAPAFGNFLLFARFNNNRPDFPLLDDLRPVPEDWLQAIRATGDVLSAEVAWEPGDLLMLDNTRFLHGRTAIRDPGERLVATFFGYVGFALPDPEEPADPIWRRQDWAPPLHPELVR